MSIEAESTDFEAAFAEAMGEPVQASTEVETPEPAAEPEQPAVVEEQEAPEVVAEAEPQEPAAEEPAPVAEAPAAQPAPAPVDPKYLAQAIAEAQELQRQAAEQATQQKAKAQQDEKTYSVEDFLDENQKKAVDLLNSEWSEVAAPVQALIDANVKAALANYKREILGQVSQQLAPIQQVTAQSQEAAHWATIAAAHPDYQQVASELPGWIEKQPSLLRKPLEAAYAGGSAAEVVELISTYKQAIGSTGAAPAQPASSAAQVTPKAAPVSKAALAATAAPPVAQRSKMATSKDPNDFEGAFAEAASR